MNLSNLKKLVRQGEGIHLEFKRKVKHPDKIARELIAFANTEGGTLLIGVDDDKTIIGSKQVDEEAYVLNTYLEKYCYPKLSYIEERITVNEYRSVIAIHITESKKKPHRLKERPSRRSPGKVFVRVKDMSVTASQEMIQLLHRQRKMQGTEFEFGENERKVLQLFEQLPSMRFDEIGRRLMMSKQIVSRTLVQLAAAGLLRIQPTEKGDFYTLVEEAFLM